eukprot:g32752.t1
MESDREAPPEHIAKPPNTYILFLVAYPINPTGFTFPQIPIQFVHIYLQLATFLMQPLAYQTCYYGTNGLTMTYSLDIRGRNPLSRNILPGHLTVDSHLDWLPQYQYGLSSSDSGQ